MPHLPPEISEWLLPIMLAAVAYFLKTDRDQARESRVQLQVTLDSVKTLVNGNMIRIAVIEKVLEFSRPGGKRLTDRLAPATDASSADGG